MDASYIIYSLAVAWFTYHVFWMAMRIYQFTVFPKTYGQQPLLSLDDLGNAACSEQRDIPAFNVIVPAYMETDVIESTLYRLYSMNYPRTHYEVNVVTYEDEPVEKNGVSTTQAVQQVAQTINADANRTLIRSIVTPAGYDGFFPGNVNASKQHIGKARGLNYALRCIHENNERDERSFFIGKMSRTGLTKRVSKILSSLSTGLNTSEEFSSFIAKYFNKGSGDYLGALSDTSQLKDLVRITQEAASTGRLNHENWLTLVNFIEQEAPRFFLKLKLTEKLQNGYENLELIEMPDKGFLFSVVCSVEEQEISELENYSARREKELEKLRPILLKALQNAENSDEIFQLSKKINSRWVLVYDADADAPIDVMRHLAGRILSEPDVMGFQGPVAPLLNYDSVHPLCRMGALWMAFWHGAAYPRLLHNKAWAHPLAGTNWCFRIEGFEEGNHLIRNCPYNETRRRFLLKFDPRQLTEDLETGIRNFSEWSVNAAWHPIVEMEQVPPTVGGIFRQHSRWSLGTLQTMSYILTSRLPLSQKIWYLIYPLRVLFASSGPFITSALIIAIYMDKIQVEPIFAWWTLFLVFGNLIYIWAFIKTFERYYDMHQQYSAVSFLYKNKEMLLDVLEKESVCLTSLCASQIKNTIEKVKNGMAPNGFVTKYLSARYADDDLIDDSYPESIKYIKQLKEATPECIHPGHFHEFIKRIDQRLEDIQINDSDDCFNLRDEKKLSKNNLPDLIDKMVILVENATHNAGVDKRIRWSKYHTQILIWAIPFVYFSVTPFFNAFWRWAKGENASWNKTARTVKRQIYSIERKSSDSSKKNE